MIKFHCSTSSYISELGRCLALKRIKVVFGGSKFGLLGKLADSVLTNGGQITGIIPEFFTSMTTLWILRLQSWVFCSLAEPARLYRYSGRNLTKNDFNLFLASFQSRMTTKQPVRRLSFQTCTRGRRWCLIEPRGLSLCREGLEQWRSSLRLWRGWSWTCTPSPLGCSMSMATMTTS